MGMKQKQSLAEVPDASLPPCSHLHLASCSSFPPPPPSPGEPFEGLFHPLNVVIEQDSDVGWKISLSRSAPGCVTRHTRHASVTHFRPISGNIVEVPLVTPPIIYINSHA